MWKRRERERGGLIRGKKQKRKELRTSDTMLWQDEEHRRIKVVVSIHKWNERQIQKEK